MPAPSLNLRRAGGGSLHPASVAALRRVPTEPIADPRVEAAVDIGAAVPGLGLGLTNGRFRRASAAGPWLCAAEIAAPAPRRRDVARRVDDAIAQLDRFKTKPELELPHRAPRRARRRCGPDPFDIAETALGRTLTRAVKMG